ncbi:unnamed protein product [Mycena citricolor]|uniref:Uncharacterized protein n=1 Tax=Mycena citricolor TaxID=2018698 RepID=A0AAD2K204_9AGAR|nr:unnamed protein product [Mycena citricolor]
MCSEPIANLANVMQVVAGNTDCLTTTVSALSPPASTSQAASSSVVPTSLSSPSPSPSKSDATAVSTTSATPARASRPGPSIGAVVAIILAVSAIFLVGLALFWRSHRTWMKQMAEANADQERPPSEKPQGRFLGAVLGRAEGPSPLRSLTPFRSLGMMLILASSAYREETPPPPITPPKSWFVGTRAAISPGASSSDGRGQQDFTPDSGDGPHDKLKITIPPQTRRFVVSNAATPVVHTDGGVRLLVSERDLPPVYYKYS